MRFHLAIALGFVVSFPFAQPSSAQSRVPGERWMRFADPAEAGFDPAGLEAARETWESLPSSAFLVVADGAVVAGWGDLERRFMCHSVRKSFLSALYGIYWDRGALELNKTLFDLGLDDEPEPLLETEKRARILDLLKARSGVFHPAAYAGRTDSRPRGSEGPGRFFAYNNWDFNTLATILKMELDVDVFEAFDEHFARPLGMQDWRVSDGYYHYESDKSKYPAYPFRLSARDAARFGLLFARQGKWGDEQVLSRYWVRRSTALYSIDNDMMGYGFMWWVFLEPRFEPHGMVSALGVGNQMIAALPDSDLVIVNRANTYANEGTPMPQLLDLIEQILAARTGEVAAEPELVPLADAAVDPKITSLPAEDLQELVGAWPFPPAVLGRPAQGTVEIVSGEGHVIGTYPGWGTFAVHPQPDGTLFEEDSHQTYYAIRDAEGAFAGLADASAVIGGALSAAAADDAARADELLALLPASDASQVALAEALILTLAGDVEAAESAARALAEGSDPNVIESAINGHGYGLLQAEQPEAALLVFELNTQAFPEASNTWDSLAEVHLTLGHDEEALVFYEMSLDLDDQNENARQQMARIREAAAERE